MQKPLVKLNPDTFRRAAVKVARGSEHFACNAIWKARGKRTHNRDGWNLLRDAEPHVVYFTRIFKPKRPRPPFIEGWYGHAGDSRTRVARVLGLLLCELLARDGFNPS